ncbi:GMC oxidoreductase-like protein [Thermothelomyces thermophilus ATCC 42464]|uniref:GMC oxidoreductase-like protein n=1 Tax=Thermothelomyces thermophilus (strain ATCC 42464 / BCRC 31852 / DSM 1799) TaxID=573729 RepID=G2QDZ2_THET4|nr:GMC oxidoreductase-like protein [Thermothelomyces thermophilus ATCC 42464]AEO58401.1 GMC oxidoreductase-like protein [Thermothelomyces thermophilus ATCC 42464]
MELLRVSLAAVALSPLILFGVAAAHPTARSIARSTILDGADGLLPEYDYIIIGGGTSGLTVADRLTENRKHSVLVLERGIFQNSSSVTTISGGSRGLFDPSLTFNINSVPQAGLDNRSIAVIGGLILGGSSGVNGLQVLRGQREDYDRWGSYFGPNSDWSWKGLLPYFKKAWNFHPPRPELVSQFDIKYDPSYWGNTSDVHASFPTTFWPVLKLEMAAFGDIPGVEYPPDSASGETGAYWHPASVDPATVLRSFARPAHWDNIEAARPNYHTLTGQRVLKVAFDGNRATSVVFVPANATDHSTARSVKAKKEIVLAAGAIHTPQILQASGVGPKQVLKEAGVPLVVDAPGVGSNFQDQPYVVAPTFNFTKFPFHPDFYDMILNQTFIAEAQAQFEKDRTGPHTIASGYCGSWLPLQIIAPNSWKDIARRYESQDPAAYLPAGTDETVIEGYRAQQKALARSMRSKQSAMYNFFLRGGYEEGSVVYLHPTSRGTVRINRSDPFFSPPEVDYRALSNPTDLEVLLEFTPFTRRYFLETRLKSLDPVELSPGANVTAPADIEAWLRSVMIPSSFHPIGTAAMLPRHLGGVVDENLLVYGVEGLSVVDASVMPDLPGSYTQQTVYAIAEKAADLIKSRA